MDFKENKLENPDQKVIKNDLAELFFIIGFIALFSIFPLFQIFLKMNFVLIIFLVVLTILFNIGANYLTKTLVYVSLDSYESNPIMHKTIEKKSSYFILPIILIGFLILIYLFSKIMLGNIVVIFTVVVAIDFIHDLRVKLYGKTKFMMTRHTDEVK